MSTTIPSTNGATNIIRTDEQLRDAYKELGKERESISLFVHILDDCFQSSNGQLSVTELTSVIDPSNWTKISDFVKDFTGLGEPEVKELVKKLTDNSNELFYILSKGDDEISQEDLMYLTDAKFNPINPSGNVAIEGIIQRMESEGKSAKSFFSLEPV